MNAMMMKTANKEYRKSEVRNTMGCLLKMRGDACSTRGSSWGLSSFRRKAGWHAFLVVLSALLLGVMTTGLVYADSSGPRYPSSAYNDSSVGSRSWSDTDRARNSDNSYAEVRLSDGQTSNYVVTRNFGFSIPSGAQISGIVVDIERRDGGRSWSVDIRDHSVRLVKNGNVTGSDKANTGTDWPTSDQFATYGSSSDLWGTSWTPADINSSSFGVALAARGSARRSDDEEARVDSMRITVHYTTGPACTTNAPSVTITPTSQTISTNAGSASYSVTVKNNDTGAGCSSVNFGLSASDSNTSVFNASTLPGSVSLAAGASTTVNMTVSARSGFNSGTNSTTVTASASGRSPVTSSPVTTTINVTGTCSQNAPTVTITPSSQTIVTNAGSVSYSVTVRNNDTGSACSSVNFGLSAADSNTSVFNASTLPGSVSLVAGASTSVNMTVSARSGFTSGTNSTTVTASASGRTPVTSSPVTTTLNVGAPPPPPPTGGLIHNSANTSSAKWASQGGWGVAGGKYGEFICETCHTDSTTNIKRIKQQITVPDTSKGNIPGSVVNFQSTTGPNGFGDDTGGHSVSSKICEVCHSINRYHNYNSANNTGGNEHNNVTDCMGCHPHKEAFKPSESSGGSDCAGCHPEIFNPMNSSTNTYHHYMSSGEATYPMTAMPTDADKRCLQCHADHDIFRPDLNPANTAGRAANLRVDATVAPTAGAPGTTYTNTDFVSAAANGGICVSCHKNVLAKNTTKRKNDGTTVTPSIAKADYGASAHMYMVSSTFSKDGSTFNANCSKCHNAKNGEATTFQSSANKFGTHDSQAKRLLNALGGTLTENYEEQFCYRCHSGTGPNDYYNKQPMSAASRDIQNAFSKPYKHNVDGYSGLHKPAEQDETLAYISANKHVECGDCHDVHASGAAKHTKGTNLVSAVLKGTSGAVPTYSSGIWTTPTSYSLQTATREFEICFKCHSGANTNVASWGGTGAAAWTDVALEFNPNNRSGHPVVDSLNNYPNSPAPKTLVSAQLTGGWTPGQKMYCSDCHDTDSTVSRGPHGSATKWMLAGPNRAWPYTSASSNGTSSGTFFRLDASMTNLFCLNCHPNPMNTNNVHTESDHHDQVFACVACHIRVPHGGKVSRLISADNTGGMPARYYPNGNGTGTVYLRKYVKTSYRNYDERNCYSTNSACDDHKDNITGESW